MPNWISSALRLTLSMGFVAMSPLLAKDNVELSLHTNLLTSASMNTSQNLR